VDRFRLIYLRSTTTEAPEESTPDETPLPRDLGPISPALASGKEASDPDACLSQTILGQAKVDLTHPDPKIRMLAIRCLEKAEPDIALPLLEEMLSDPDPEVRLQGMHSLIRFISPSVSALLKKHLNDGDPRMRMTALRGLFKQKEKMDPNLLDPFVRDGSPWVRRKLATLLGWTDPDLVFPILMRLFKDPHPQVRKAALLSLITLYPQEGEDRLLEALSDPDGDIQKWAKEVLERIIRRPPK
jgi:HEAT repeat protein